MEDSEAYVAFCKNASWVVRSNPSCGNPHDETMGNKELKK